MLYTSPASSWPWVAPLHLVPKIESPYLENGVCLHASSLFAAPGSTALLRAQLVHVRVTEYDRATYV